MNTVKVSYTGEQLVVKHDRYNTITIESGISWQVRLTPVEAARLLKAITRSLINLKRREKA